MFKLNFKRFALFSLLMLLNTSALGNVTVIEVKSHYIYNFTKFVYWPEPIERFRICFYGDEQRRSFEKINNKSKKNKFDIVALTKQNASQCNVIMFSEDIGYKLEDYLKIIDGLPILTISDIEDFAYNKGGVIGLIRLGNTIRFNINLDNAKKNKLAVDFKVIELAIKVWKENER